MILQEMIVWPAIMDVCDSAAFEKKKKKKKLFYRPCTSSLILSSERGSIQLCGASLCLTFINSSLFEGAFV